MPGHGAWLPPHVFAQHTRAGKPVEARPQFAHYGATSAPMLLAELTLRESEQEGVKGLSPLARLLRARHVPLDWAHRVGWDGNGGGAEIIGELDCRHLSDRLAHIAGGGLLGGDGGGEAVSHRAGGRGKLCAIAFEGEVAMQMRCR